MPVTVYDSKDRLLIGLTKSDFNIYEDGKRQEISYFRRETDVPLRVGLLLDTSNSARRHLTFEKDAASEFAYVLLQRSRRHKLFLLAFDASLKGRDPRWGLRAVDEVIVAAKAQGLDFEKLIEMPANNISLLFRRV